MGKRCLILKAYNGRGLMTPLDSEYLWAALGTYGHTFGCDSTGNYQLLTMKKGGVKIVNHDFKRCLVLVTYNSTGHGTIPAMGHKDFPCMVRPDLFYLLDYVT